MMTRQKRTDFPSSMVSVSEVAVVWSGPSSRVRCMTKPAQKTRDGSRRTLSPDRNGKTQNSKVQSSKSFTLAWINLKTNAEVCRQTMHSLTEQTSDTLEQAVVLGWSSAHVLSRGGLSVWQNWSEAGMLNSSQVPSSHSESANEEHKSSLWCVYGPFLLVRSVKSSKFSWEKKPLYNCLALMERINFKNTKEKKIPVLRLTLSCTARTWTSMRRTEAHQRALLTRVLQTQENMERKINTKKKQKKKSKEETGIVFPRKRTVEMQQKPGLTLHLCGVKLRKDRWKLDDTLFTLWYGPESGHLTMSCFIKKTRPWSCMLIVIHFMYEVFSHIKWWVSLLFLLFFTSSCRSSSGKPILSTNVLLQTESNCPWLVLWIMKRLTAKKHYFVSVKPKKFLPVILAFFHISVFHKLLRMKNHKGNLAPLISAAEAFKSFGVVS